MVQLWLNFVVNNNELLINVDKSLIDVFDLSIDNEKLEKLIKKIILSTYNDVIVNVVFIQNQSKIKCISVVGNTTEIKSEDIEQLFDNILLLDIYYSNESIIELINAELECIDLVDRFSVENFLKEHNCIDRLLNDMYYDVRLLLNKQYMQQKLLTRD